MGWWNLVAEVVRIGNRTGRDSKVHFVILEEDTANYQSVLHSSHYEFY